MGWRLKIFPFASLGSFAGVGWRYVSTFADFALIRRWRATFPTRGKAFFGGTLLYVIPLNKGNPACWRPAWGGVRLRGNDWWERVNLGEWCRYDEVICSEMTRGGQGRGMDA